VGIKKLFKNLNAIGYVVFVAFFQWRHRYLFCCCRRPYLGPIFKMQEEFFNTSSISNLSITKFDRFYLYVFNFKNNLYKELTELFRQGKVCSYLFFRLIIDLSTHPPL
jgi:hypothetical protein